MSVTSDHHRVRAVNPSPKPQPARKPQPPPQPDESAAWSTGAWREGSAQGSRLGVDIGSLRLETGASLPQVRVAYETWGTLNAARDNAILVELMEQLSLVSVWWRQRIGWQLALALVRVNAKVLVLSQFEPTPHDLSIDRHVRGALNEYFKPSHSVPTPK